MIAKLVFGQTELSIDLDSPIDLSIPMRSGDDNPNAWYVGAPKFAPVKLDDWEGSVASGAAVNFTSMQIIPHAHGTHTESLGHISATPNNVNSAFHRYFFKAQLITVDPDSKNGDKIIDSHHFQDHIKDEHIEALIVRTQPNSEEKKTRQYSHTNWPYLTKAAAQWLCRKGIQHFLIDTPSVDKEKDDGKLVAHRAFWDMDGFQREHATITEFIYAHDSVLDGIYILELQLPNLVSDAVPSRPLIYKILES